MRLVNINYAEDKVLAQPIVDAMGRTLLKAGVKLSRTYIERLSRLGIDMVSIEDSQLDDVEFNLAIKPRTRELAYEAVKSIKYCIETNRLLKIDQMRNTIQQMISDLISGNNILGYLSDVRGYDEFTFHHSINTTIVALVMGLSAGFKESKLLELGLGVLMHDVGKIKIPAAILNKIDPLTTEEFDLIKKHPEFGYKILRTNKEMGIVAAHVAFQHQERWDGSGYPRNLKGEDIHEYGRIAAVADVYDALTSVRVYRSANEPYHAYEFILAHSGVHFDPKFIDIFSKHIAIYPNGSGIILSNGQRGNVIKQNVGYPDRPHVRVFFQGEESLQSPIDYDLINHPSLMIVGVDNR